MFKVSFAKIKIQPYSSFENVCAIAQRHKSSFLKICNRCCCFCCHGQKNPTHIPPTRLGPEPSDLLYSSLGVCREEKHVNRSLKLKNYIWKTCDIFRAMILNAVIFFFYYFLLFCLNLRRR